MMRGSQPRIANGRDFLRNIARVQNGPTRHLTQVGQSVLRRATSVLGADLLPIIRRIGHIHCHETNLRNGIDRCLVNCTFGGTPLRIRGGYGPALRIREMALGRGTIWGSDQERPRHGSTGRKAFCVARLCASETRAMIADWTVRMGLLIWRYQSERWRQIQVIR